MKRILRAVFIVALATGWSQVGFGLDFEQVTELIFNDDFAAFQSLVTTTADATAISEQGYSLIQVVSGRVSLKYVAHLVKLGARFNQPVPETAPAYRGYTPLMLAAQGGQLETVKYLESLGADIYYQTPLSHNTPMDAACMGGALGVVKYLLPKMPNRSQSGDLPHLLWAISYKRPNVALYLLDNGADPTQVEGGRYTFLHILAEGDVPEVLKELLDRNLNWEVEASGGMTPIFVAVAHSVTTTRELVKKGVNLDLYDGNQGLSVLQTAIHAANPYTVQLLLDAGLDARKVIPGNHQTAIDYAKADGKDFLLPQLTGTRRVPMPAWTLADEIDTGLVFHYDLAQDLVLPGLDSGSAHLSDFRGKTVVLNFWASWCDPSEREIPSLTQMYEDSRSQGLEVLGISLDESRQEAQDFARRNSMSFPLFLIDTLTFNGRNPQFKVGEIPTSYFVDKNGFVISQVSQSLDWSKPKIQRFLTMMKSLPAFR